MQVCVSFQCEQTIVGGEMYRKVSGQMQCFYWLPKAPKKGYKCFSLELLKINSLN